ncbi:acyl-CoA dehydrogenase family protein [Halodurantibacterium flavum]|uniref:Acyl-CoA dehydrogenase family protein n=1 Tax=Halodurantibacterium flavum TaxID=1382802 RepID=A0ABW4S893_9RHOB
MDDLEQTRALMAVTPGWQVQAEAAGLDDATVTAILSEAAKFAEGVLAPLNPVADRTGCRLQDGRVATPPGYAGAWLRLGQDGWLSMDLAEGAGGQGLPLTLHAAAAPFFEGAAMAFMMLAGSTRAAAHLLTQTGGAVAAEWVPRLASGDWTATICISEPDAGSDVGRIRTRAEEVEGGWRITGSKIWISFGDHDMADRIGHLLLARTGPASAGTRGLSLFLVPDRTDSGARNGITVTRIEEKMGLHGSPTCALSFAGSEGILLGEAGRGLPQLFRMIELMRLQTACQGLGIAQRALAIARSYASERLQGGPPDAPPVPLGSHPDVRRQLLAIAAPTAVLRALVLELSTLMDGDEGLAGYLLPLAKNFGAETGFQAASGAMQVLGGAGYTREWPVEQLLRDARVIAIYEGTTGMQAQDFLIRRLIRDGGQTLGRFLDRARAGVAACRDEAARDTATAVLDRFDALSRDLLAGAASPELAADGYLRAGWLAVTAWLACRLIEAGSEREGRFALHDLSERMAGAEALCHLPAWV